MIIIIIEATEIILRTKHQTIKILSGPNSVLLEVKARGKYSYILNCDTAFNVISQLSQAHTFQHYSLKSTLKISYHLRLGFPSVLFLSN